MRPAGLAHMVIVVQSTTKKNAKPRCSAIGAQAHLDHLLRAAHQRRALTGAGAGRQARRQKVRRIIRPCLPRRCLRA